jgi:hypothetical protein
MKCSSVRKRLIEYVETERGLPGARGLPQHIVDAIAAHLDQCPRCRREAEAIRATFTVAGMTGEIEPTADFKQRTVRLLRQEAQRVTAPAPVAVWLRPALAYAVILVALAILVAVLVPERAVRVELATGSEEFEQQVERYAEEIEFLAQTLPGSEDESISQVERSHLDKIDLLASSIDQCWDAFEENPENVRVRRLLLAQMQEEVNTLKSFLEVRSL